MNILLLGDRGYLGSFLKEGLNADSAPTGVDYNYVINCIGKPNLEFCEENPDISYASNYKIVADTIKRYPKSKIIHFSSYYVYDDVGCCTEESKITQEYSYCKHKIMSEEILNNHNGLVFRIGKIFGPSKGKRQNKLTEHLLFSKEVTLDEVEFNPTSLHQILRAVEYEIEHGNLEGIYNLANAGKASHYEYGKFIQRHFNHKLKINKIKRHDRAFHNYGRFLMSCDKIKKVIPLINWEDDMIQYLKEMRKCIV